VAIDFEPILSTITPKQRLFVEAKLKGMPDGTARRIAGSEARYDEELAEQRVADALKACQALSARDLGVTRDTLHNMLMEAYRACADAKEVVLVVRALAELYGLNAPKKLEVKNTGTIVHRAEQLRSLSNDELEKLAHSDAIDAEFTITPRLEHQRG
jgi:hypothetical protein